jgi:D-beta-D-heptose 7-phosphate kinase/D-beta-D-heptose 1-phosphate adenosyltransferase
MKQTFVPDRQAHILVIGDVILDRYVHGETTRISPEAPVPVVLVRQTEERPGGAGNVALNISMLGPGVSLVGLTGKDSKADKLADALTALGVNCRFVKQDGFPTITKLRVLSQHQQLIRLDYEADSDQADSDGLFRSFRELVRGADTVVLSDYAKGSLKNVQAFIAECNSLKKKVLIDPKGSDFTRYKGASLLTPNLREFETIVGECTDVTDIVSKGIKLCKELHLEALLVTRGEHGMTLISPDDEPFHLAAEAREVFDVTGAGDTVIATMAAALASGYGYAEAAKFANRAAGLVVAKLGAASVTADELNNAVISAHREKTGNISEAELMEIVKHIRSRGESIVMTNGCFDILHAGHVSYLQQARQLGDYLIVAINDDDSVTRLKGKGRPLNPLDQRRMVLNALKPVDWVIPFSEDTPERLVNAIKPDVLVKGGDYRPDQIAGAATVLGYGGKVEIIPLVQGCSTTQILNTARSAEKSGQ